jgi:hypothetical protein
MTQEAPWGGIHVQLKIVFSLEVPVFPLGSLFVGNPVSLGARKSASTYRADQWKSTAIYP